MSVLIRCAVALASAALVATSVVTATAASAEPVTTPSPDVATTTLSLINGWSSYGGGTGPAQVSKTAGIATFSGAISTSGSSSLAFRLPAAYRPTADVYIPVDLCNATNGRLVIQPDGNTFVQAGTDFANAQCFTSLEGASYAVATAGFTTLSPINGWTSAPFSTRTPGIKNVNGVATFKGAIGTSGSNSVPFVLPAAFRPKANVYVKVDLCNATNGRLIIQSSGSVLVQAESNFANAQCFTSLEGVSYLVGGAGARVQSPVNGWTGQPFNTRAPAAKTVGGVVHLMGAVATSGTSSNPIVLKVAFRPSTTVYVPVDMCGATNGRLIISPNGVVSVQAETNFSNAACFTSLEGAQFRL